MYARVLPEGSAHRKRASSPSVMTNHPLHAVVHALNSSDTYRSEKKTFWARVVLSFFYEMGTLFTVFENKAPIFEKKVESYELENFVNLILQMKTIRTTLVVTTSLCTTVRHVIHSVILHATMLTNTTYPTIQLNSGRTTPVMTEPAMLLFDIQFTVSLWSTTMLDNPEFISFYPFLENGRSPVEKRMERSLFEKNMES